MTERYLLRISEEKGIIISGPEFTKNEAIRLQKEIIQGADTITTKIGYSFQWVEIIEPDDLYEK